MFAHRLHSPRLTPALLSLMLIAAALMPALVKAQPAEPPPAPVELDPVQSEPVAPVQWTPGSVISRADAEVAGEQAGRLTFVADVGETVSAGGVLARIDDQMLRLALAEADAAVARIAAQRSYTEAQTRRLTQLAEQGTVSRAQADEVAAQLKMLDQERVSAEVSQRQARHRLANSVVRAPFAGTVVARLLEQGEFLPTGAAVVRLVDTARQEIQLRAPVGLSAFARPGQAVAVRMGDQRFEGQIRTTVPVGDAQSRQFELRVVVAEATLAIGSALDVGLPSAAPRVATTISRDALVLRPGERYVVRVAADGGTERVTVEPGGSARGRIEVNGTLEAGDQLVVRGAERLRPGQRVSVRAPVASAAAADPDLARLP